jgi:asparagine N-glycosylation enzyme membrane subunit Stt3
MARAIVSEVLLFVLPFAVFAIYLLARRRNPLAWEAWSGQVSWLVIAGLALAIASLLYAGIAGERQQGAFVPTHLENGRVVPGEFKR